MPPIIDQATLQRYSEVVGDVISRLLRPTPAELCHYTTGENLVKILESGELWSTQVSCVNDASEFRYAIRVARAAFQRRLESGETLSDEQRACLREINDALSIEGTETAGYFVACLSENRDDLSQWRSYGSAEGGYAIRFAVDKLAALRKTAFLAPITYDRAQQIVAADDVVTKTLSMFDEGKRHREGACGTDWMKAFLEAWGNAVSYIAPLLKDDAFAAEKEWRLIRRLMEGDVPNMKYRQRQSMLSRHLPLVFEPPVTDKRPMLPLAEIMVGPSRHKVSSSITVGDMLKTFGYPAGQVSVSISRVPYQAL
jgi:hypothetical protein